MNKARITTLIFGIITLISIMLWAESTDPWIGRKTIRYDMEENVISEETVIDLKESQLV